MFILTHWIALYREAWDNLRYESLRKSFTPRRHWGEYRGDRSRGKAATTTGGTSNALASYSDEFNSGSTTLAGRGWTDGNPSAYSALSINTTVSGKLMIIPNSNVVWYYDLRGVFIYKQISGNFVARSYVRAGRVGSGTATEGPTKEYNSIGLIAYNPSSTAGNRNWVVNNLGYQHAATGVGTEAKTTKTSVSHYYLKNGVNSGLIVMCRIGANFYSNT